MSTCLAGHKSNQRRRIVQIAETLVAQHRVQRVGIGFEAAPFRLRRPTESIKSFSSDGLVTATHLRLVPGMGIMEHDVGGPGKRFELAGLGRGKLVARKNYHFGIL